MAERSKVLDCQPCPFSVVGVEDTWMSGIAIQDGNREPCFQKGIDQSGIDDRRNDKCAVHATVDNRFQNLLRIELVAASDDEKVVIDDVQHVRGGIEDSPNVRSE